VTRPRLLDLFSGAGGAAMGYHRAGFDVVGVDLNPKVGEHYPFEFHQGDALEYLAEHGAEFDAIHASPPCQSFSGMTNCRPGLADNYPQLIDAARALLTDAGTPWVIENVAGSGLPRQADFFGAHGIELCGALFGLALYRHRLFETSIPVAGPPHPRHLTPASKAGHWQPGTVISVEGNCSPIALARTAMGIDWMPRAELAEAIPPAYTQFIGEQIITHIEAVAA
jgi:DNA (cytosine-5)-methyltransferase 1